MKISTQKQNFIKILSMLLAMFVVCTLLCACTNIVPNDGEVSITVVQSPIRLIVGESVTLKVDSSDKNAQIEWYVSDESIAKVVGGVITGVGVGETQVVVDCGNLLSICDVVVSAAPDVDEPPIPVDPTPDTVVINLNSITVEVGKSVVLTAFSSTGHDIKWYSVNSGIATVDNGVITGVSIGETMISASAGRASVTCMIKVVEAQLPPKPVDPIDPPDPIDPTKPTKDGYELVWNDEFEGNSLDASKWGYQYGVQDHYGNSYGPMYWGNGELQYYTDSPSNVGVNNDSLYITAKRESKGDRQFTSARILTRDKFSCTYGYFEARMQLPTQNAMWPAFWMLPEPSTTQNNSNPYGHWPTSGEIDIMEARGRIANQIGTALHYSVNNGHRYSNATADLIFPISDWHVYAVEWTKDYMTWYVDGREVMKLASSVWYNASLNSTSAAPFDQPFYLLINLAVGGSYDGGLEPDATFTQGTMYVDYVRVWKPLKGI